MQRKILWFSLLCIGGLLLAACRAQQDNSTTSGVAAVSTPSISTLKALVTVNASKTHYTPDETITIKIENGMPISIAATNHQSGCTIVTLQWQDAQGNWQDLNRCRLGLATRMITLPPGTSQMQSIAPTAGTFARSAVWLKGNYRIVFDFTFSNPDSESSPLTSARVSPTFLVS